jgi:hypothetical protein
VEVSIPKVPDNFTERLKPDRKVTGKVDGKQEPVHTGTELIYDPNHLT